MNDIILQTIGGIFFLNLDGNCIKDSSAYYYNLYIQINDDIMKFGLSDRVIQKFSEVFSKYPAIDSVVIYSSRAKGNFREGSDIDITLMGNQVTEDIRSKVWLDLDDLNTPYLIDLSVFHKLNSPDLCEHITRV